MSDIDMNPGGRLARKKGCHCPELDNGHGNGRGDGTFWVDPACKLHGEDLKAYATQTDKENE